MKGISYELGKIDLSRPFAEQEAIQNFLAPSFSEDVLSVPNELLFRLLLVAKQLITQALQNPDPEFAKLRLYAAQLGYRRNIIIQTADGKDEVKRIESQFVSDERWESAENKETQDTENTQKKKIQELLNNVTEKVTQELQRIYPMINVNAEWDVYLSAVIGNPSKIFLESAPLFFKTSACGTCSDGTSGNMIGNPLTCRPCS